MDNSYSYIQKQRIKSQKQKSRLVTLVLLMILFFVSAMFVFTFYVKPYLTLQQQTQALTQKKEMVFANVKYEESKFSKKSYAYISNNKYYIYDENIELKFEKNKYNETQLQSLIKANNINVIKTTVGIANEKPAIFLELDNKTTWVIDYDSMQVIYYGELK